MPTLSEHESKQLLASCGVPVGPEGLASDPDGAVRIAVDLGLPVVAKLCGASIAHKTERGLVRLGLVDAPAVRAAATELLAASGPEDGEVGVLVAPMVSGRRELIAGVVRDPQFGACVMVGFGGILAEGVADVQFRLAPITSIDAEEMIEGLATQRLLGPFRGEASVDREALVAVLVGLSDLVTDRADVVSVDINPLIVTVDGQPVLVDALVEVQA